MKTIIHAIRMFTVLLALVSGSAEAFARTKITVGYTPAAAFLPIFVAKQKEMFVKRGLNVALQVVPVTPNLVGGVLSGSLTLATLTPSMMIKAVEGGAPLVIIAAGTLYDNVSGGVVARFESKIKSAADFVGKKVGIPGINSVMQILFIQWLKSQGVDSDKVEFVEIGFAQMGDLLKAGQIDAATVTEPFLSRIRDNSMGHFVVNYASAAQPSYLETFYASTELWAKQNPDAVAKFREALSEAIKFIKSSPGEATKIQASYLKLPEAMIAKIPTPNFSTNVTPVQVKYWIDLMKELQFVRGNLTADSLIIK